MQLLNKLLLSTILVFTLYFFFPVQAHAGVIPTLVGQVLNKSTGAGIGGVWVKWKSSGYAVQPGTPPFDTACGAASGYRYAQTDANGNFSFDPVGPGNCWDQRIGRPIDTNLDGVNDDVEMNKITSCTTTNPLWVVGTYHICTGDYGCAGSPAIISVIKPSSWAGTVDPARSVPFSNLQSAGSTSVGTYYYYPAFTISGNVAYDANNTGSTIPFAWGAGITLSNGKTAASDKNGNYSFVDLSAGSYNVSLSVPTGYTNTTPTTVAKTLGPNATANFTLAPTYTINGAVFNDINGNGVQDNGEPNYSGTPQITSNKGTVITNSNGTYSITNLPAGTVTVSYPSLPSGFLMSYPLNGPPPSFQVTVGPGCGINGALGASCN